MKTQEIYDRVKFQRKRGLDYQMVHRWNRQDPELWALSRERVWLRDQGICQSPIDASPKKYGLCQRQISLRECHIDHIRPLSSGGSNHARNLRTLCPICHALREDEKHRSMILNMVKKQLIPVEWKKYTWEAS